MCRNGCGERCERPELVSEKGVHSGMQVGVPTGKESNQVRVIGSSGSVYIRGGLIK